MVHVNNGNETRWPWNYKMSFSIHHKKKDGGIKKDESRQVTWAVIYTNQATSLARDIAVRSVIGLYKSDYVSDVICAPVL